MTRSLLLAGLLATLLPLAAHAGTVTAKTTDGGTVALDVAGSGARGVVFVAEPGSGADGWRGVRDRFAGHGAHAVIVAPRAAGADGSLEGATADVRAAVAWLADHGATTIHVVGTGTGGNVALHAAAAEPRVTSVVWSAPRLSAPGLKLTTDLDAYGKRPVLLLTSQEDGTGARAAAAIESHLAGPHKTETLARGATGVAIFEQAPAVDGVVLAWVDTEAPALQRPGAAVGTSGLDTLQTTGHKYGE
ncbi:MAG: alpha/beta hydrolase [Alphaproteobacteria bacterium]|nr:alpha/beta hydrolase [Alphaproteobacteria bacterium]